MPTHRLPTLSRPWQVILNQFANFFVKQNATNSKFHHAESQARFARGGFGKIRLLILGLVLNHFPNS